VAISWHKVRLPPPAARVLSEAEGLGAPRNDIAEGRGVIALSIPEGTALRIPAGTPEGSLRGPAACLSRLQKGPPGGC
jgi:hypothetical protein